MMDDFALHPDTQKALESQIARPAQALLVTGQSGIGLTSCARYIAATLLQTTPELLSGNEYYREVSPIKAVITIDQVRSVQQFLRLKVPGGAAVSRVVLFDDADMLHPAAQNALLKLLEEPPVGAVLLLVSHSPDHLLPTVRSRLSTLAIKSPTKEQTVAYFVERGHDGVAVARQYVVSGGSLAAMSQALSSSEQDTPAVMDDVRRLLGGNTYERLIQLDKIAKDKAAALVTVALLAEVAAASLEQAARSGKSSVERWRGILTAAYAAGDALGKNGNTKLVLTDLALSL